MSEITAEEAKKLKVVDLKAELQKRSLDTKGKKGELLDRLLASLGESTDQRSQGDESHGDDEDVDASGAQLPVENEPKEAEGNENKINSDGAEANDEAVTEADESMDEGVPQQQVEESAPADGTGDAETATDETVVDGDGAKAVEDVEKDGSGGGEESMQVLDEAVAEESDLLEVPVQPEDRAPEMVVLDNYNSDLHFRIEGDGVTGSTQSAGGLYKLWGGARANWGAKSGKVFFHIKVEEGTAIEEGLLEPAGVRIGFSQASGQYALGDEAVSFGYASTGHAVCASESRSYGCKFSIGDTVTCCLDLDSSLRTVAFLVNGEPQGVAFTLPETVEPGTPLFPHVDVKNLKVVVCFDNEGVDFAAPEGYVGIGSLEEEAKSQGGKGPEKAEDASVILLVGLPAVGKTTWARKHVADTAEKCYNVIGVDHVIERMRVSPDGPDPAEFWRKYTQVAVDIQNKLFCLAEKRCRNYIMDQTNVFNSVQRRRMQPFGEYGHREAVVIVTERSTLAERTLKRERETGRIIPADALARMASGMSLPQDGRTFSAVTYVELDAEKTKQLVQAMLSESQQSSRYSSAAKRPRYASGGYGRSGYDNDNRDRRGGSSRDSRDYGSGRRDYGYRSNDRYNDRSRSSSSGGYHGSGGYHDRSGSSSGYSRPPPPSYDRRPPPPVPRYEPSSSYGGGGGSRFDSRRDYSSGSGYSGANSGYSRGGGGSYGRGGAGGSSSYGRGGPSSGSSYSRPSGGSSYSGSGGYSAGSSSYGSGAGSGASSYQSSGGRYDSYGSSSSSYASQGTSGSSYGGASSYRGGNASSSYGSSSYGNSSSGYGGASGSGYGGASTGSGYGTSSGSGYGASGGSNYGGSSTYGSGSSSGGYGQSAGTSSYGSSGGASSYGSSSTTGYGSSYGRGGGSNTTSYGQTGAARSYGQTGGAQQQQQQSYGSQGGYRSSNTASYGGQQQQQQQYGGYR